MAQYGRKFKLMGFKTPEYAAASSGGGGFDADYQAILDYATLKGYTLPSSAQQTAQNTLLLAMKSSGVWAKRDRIYIHAQAGSSSFGLINWKSPSDATLATLVNSPTFVSNGGFTGNGTSSYINYNYAPDVDAVLYTQSDACFDYSISAADTAPGTNVSHLIIYTNPSSSYRHTIRFTTNRVYGHNSTFLSYVNWNEATTGIMNHSNLPNSGTIDLYQDGTRVDNLTGNTTMPFSSSGYVYGLRNDAGFSNATLSMAAWGSALTGTEASNYNTAWKAYLASL